MADATCSCGNAINQSGRGRPRKSCATCTPPATFKRKPPGAALVCPVCSASFVPGNSLAKTCGRDSCKWATRKKAPCSSCGEDTGWAWNDQRLSANPICNSCRKSQAEHGTSKMYRSFGCRCDVCRDYHNSACREYAERHRERTGQSLYRNYRDPNLRKIDAHRRRALLMDAFIEDVDPVRVFEAENYRCYGCGKQCLKDAPNNHLLQPTIDHVIPLSMGGTHEYANCRTMCRQCNCTKGNRGGGEQLLLIG